MTRFITEDATLIDRICAEVALVKEQVRRSQAVRQSCGAVRVAHEEDGGDMFQEAGLQPADTPTGPSDVLLRDGPFSAPAREDSLVLRKEGTLLVLEKGTFGREKFVPRFVVVDEHMGVMWYQCETHSRLSPSEPLGQVAFWRETRNSRGTRFKRAAVCWPRVLQEDCPKADDTTKMYFAVEYLNQKEAYSKVIFAADSETERNDWVFFITHFIDLFLLPCAESDELRHLPRGATTPRHISGVIDEEISESTVM